MRMRKIIFGMTYIALVLWGWNGCQSSNSRENAKGPVEELDLEHWKNKGQKYALKAQQALGENLKAALQKGGPVYALDFCNIQAIQITDSAAREMDISLKRVSDKYRNPDNKANDNEATYIAHASAQLAAGETAHPAIQEIGGRLVGYYPIITNEMCMNCHGQPDKDIADATGTKIGELYPDDRAVGYRPLQIRGIWVVEMDAKE